jgi:hypothetical protein
MAAASLALLSRTSLPDLTAATFQSIQNTALECNAMVPMLQIEQYVSSAVWFGFPIDSGASVS